MCGINGFNFRDEDLIKKMMAFTKNRGPVKRHSEEYYNPDLLWSLVCLQVFLKSYKL